MAPPERTKGGAAQAGVTWPDHLPKKGKVSRLCRFGRKLGDSSAVRARVQVAMRARLSRAFAMPVWLTEALSARACSSDAYVCPPPPLLPPVLWVCGGSCGVWGGSDTCGRQLRELRTQLPARGMCVWSVNNPFYVVQPNP